MGTQTQPTVRNHKNKCDDTDWEGQLTSIWHEAHRYLLNKKMFYPILPTKVTSSPYYRQRFGRMGYRFFRPPMMLTSLSWRLLWNNPLQILWLSLVRMWTSLSFWLLPLLPPKIFCCWNPDEGKPKQWNCPPKRCSTVDLNIFCSYTHLPAAIQRLQLSGEAKWAFQNCTWSQKSLSKR